MSFGEDFAVTIGALSSEAEKWRVLADEMAVVRDNCEGLHLYWSAFFFTGILSLNEQSNAYDGFLQRLTDLFTDATNEFDQISLALDKAEEMYVQLEKSGEYDLRSIYGTPP